MVIFITFVIGPPWQVLVEMKFRMGGCSSVCILANFLLVTTITPHATHCARILSKRRPMSLPVWITMHWRLIALVFWIVQREGLQAIKIALACADCLTLILLSICLGQPPNPSCSYSQSFWPTICAQAMLGWTMSELPHGSMVPVLALSTDLLVLSICSFLPLGHQI